MKASEAVAPKSESITVECDLPHAPAKVWRALTEPELLGSWLMKNDIRPEVGHRFTMKAQPAEGWDGVVQCEVLEVEPLKRLRFAWRGGAKEITGYGHYIDTTVTWTLTAIDTGTRLRLDHDGLPPRSFALKAMGEGWNRLITTCLKGLLARMEGKPALPH